MLVGGFAAAQIVHPEQPMPNFEVATIRPWKPSQPLPPPGGEALVRKIVKEAPVGPTPPPSSRVHFIGQMELLIESAFDLPTSSDSRIIGGPEWIRSESDRYDLSAKIEDAKFAEMQKLPATQQRKQISLMEQSLLEDRLGMKVHFETREMPVFGLAVLRTGPKLKPSQGETSRLSEVSSSGQHILTATAVSMDDLVSSPFLRGVGRPLVDQTALHGRYDFTLTWSADDLAVAQDSSMAAPRLPAALEQQLGLKLMPAKAAVEVIVIDHIERPSEN